MKGEPDMADIEFFPELRTAGGEAVSIYRRGEWIGDMYLIYRENGLLSGTIHFDANFIQEDDKEEVLAYIRPYIHSLRIALDLEETSINVVFGRYSFLEDEEEDEVWGEQVNGYERWIVGVGKEGIEYQVYDEDEELFAEAVVDIRGTEIYGDINFIREPKNEEMNDLEALLIKDYDLDLVDKYHFTYTVNGEAVEETIVEANDEYATEEDEDEDESVYELYDEGEEKIGEAALLVGEDGNTDITVNLSQAPSDDLLHDVSRTLLNKALDRGTGLVDIRIYYNEELVDGFHFTRGSSFSNS